MSGEYKNSEYLHADALAQSVTKYFGFSGFRPGQREVIEAVLRGGPVVAVMPTGAGKSLCYQLPALFAEKNVLVVSPLISLMKDQVDALAGRGISATYINSQQSPQERQTRLQEAKQGRYRLIYVAPERFRSEDFLNGMKQVPLGGMAIDEAHCISQWGHDFRPDYLKLPEIATKLTVQQICAFTATATPEVLQDICRALSLVKPDVFVYGFRRDNLTLRVIPIVRMRDKLDHIVEMSLQIPGSGIVYAATRKHVEAVTMDLQARGVSSGMYHAGMDEAERNSVQDRFMNGEIRVMVATNAFGMGVDKSDIRFVAHYDVPGSVEAYYQEAGRAGRDGRSAECVILFSYADVRVHEFFISRFGMDNPDITPHQVEYRRQLEKAKLRRIVGYCYAETCRHAEILGYFGDKTPIHVPCGVCDRCENVQGTVVPRWARPRAAQLPSSTRGSREGRKPVGPIQRVQKTHKTSPDSQTIVTQKLLSAVARSRGRLTVAEIVTLVLGNSRQIPADLVDSRSFGILAGLSAPMLRNTLMELAEKNVLVSGSSGAPRPELTPLGVKIMRGETRIELMALRGEPSTTEPNHPKLTSNAPLSECDAQLLEQLKRVRLEIARATNVSAFVVAHNTVLERLAQRKPTSIADLLTIKGIGPTLAQRYGERFLHTIRTFLRTP